MQIQSVKNNQQHFGTYLGVNMQEKILLAKHRGILSSEQLRNLSKIEDDGLNVVLEISNRYFIKKDSSNKGLLDLQKHLTLSNYRKSINIVNMKGIIEQYSKTKDVFHMQKFIKLFNDDFNLADKIEKGYKLLTEA